MNVVERRFDLGKNGIGGGRDSVPCEKVLGERLASLKLCRACGRPEAGETVLSEMVNDARYQRRFRPHDGQHTVLRLGKLRQPLDIHGVKRHVLKLRLLCGPRVTGCDEHLGNRVGLCELPGQRVLAAAAADHQNVHLASLYLTH